MKKRFLSIPLIIIMLVSLLPASILSAKSSDEVDELGIEATYVPVAGENCDAGVRLGKNGDKVTITDSYWMDDYNNKLDESDYFEAFEWYTLHITVEFNETDFRTYGFYRWVPATNIKLITNTEKTIHTQYKRYRSNYASTLWYLDVSLRFKVITYCDNISLDNFGESLYVGEKPDYTFTTDANYCEVIDNMKWYPTNSPSSELGMNDVFLKNVPYTLELQLKAKNHVKFTSDFEIAGVDDQDVTISGDVATCKLHFQPFPTKIKGFAITGIVAPAAGAKPTTSGIKTTTSGIILKTIEWKGPLDSNGNFKSGETYTLYVHFDFTGNVADFVEAKNCTVNAGTIVRRNNYEVNYPDIQITFTVAGKKEINDLGAYVIDLSEENMCAWYYNSLPAKTKSALTATFAALKLQGIDLTTTGSKDLDKNGKADILMQGSSAVYTFEKISSGNLNGRYELKVNSTSYGKIRDTEKYTDYYSSIVFIMKPVAVTNLKAQSAGRNQVKLTWTASSGSEGYLIYGQKDGKYGYITMVKGNSYTDTKALDTDYNYYWVFPYVKNASGEYVTAGCAKYVYAKGVTAAVTNLKANGTTGKVTLTWNASAGADGYLIYGIRPGGKYGYIGMTTTGVSYVDTKASKTGWTYYWVFPYHKDAKGNMIVGGTAPYVYSKAR